MTTQTIINNWEYLTRSLPSNVCNYIKEYIPELLECEEWKVQEFVDFCEDAEDAEECYGEEWEDYAWQDASFAGILIIQ